MRSSSGPTAGRGRAAALLMVGMVVGVVLSGVGLGSRSIEQQQQLLQQPLQLGADLGRQAEVVLPAVKAADVPRTSATIAAAPSELARTAPPNQVSDEEARAELRRIGELMAKHGIQDGASRTALKSSPAYKVCNLTVFGSGNGYHYLCDLSKNLASKKPCNAFSYGIETDWSFDKDIVDRLNCNVHAFDPSVSYPENLYVNNSASITFKQVGAPLFNNSKIEKEKWTLKSPVLQAKELGIEFIAILKMDCEGCEYALYRDAIANDDAQFFHRVDQVALETHMSKFWLDDPRAVLDYGRLFVLLRRANLVLAHFLLWKCNSYHERFGCNEDLTAAGYPCTKGRMCHNLLFARVG